MKRRWEDDWSSIEITKVILQILIIVIAGGGLYLTVRQLVLLTRSYRDLHDWNRRKAAQDAVKHFIMSQKDNIIILDDAFSIMSSKDPIPLETVQKKCKESPAVRSALHSRLNYFEHLAIGVREGVLDESVIRRAFEPMFKRSVRQFKPYIEHRRATGSRNAFMDLEALITEWTGLPPWRIKTGL